MYINGTLQNSSSTSREYHYINLNLININATQKCSCEITSSTVAPRVKLCYSAICSEFLGET